MNRGASLDTCPDCDQVHGDTEDVDTTTTTTTRSSSTGGVGGRVRRRSGRHVHSHSTYVQHNDMAHWGYHDVVEEGEYGPAHWAKNYEAAGGKRQSPIDIDTKATKPITSMRDLCIDYDPSRCSSITNNGHTFTVKVEERQTNLAVNNNASTTDSSNNNSNADLAENNNPVIIESKGKPDAVLSQNNNACIYESSGCDDLSGGPLKHKYQLAQFHCHWGSADEHGAEHTIDGHRYAAELHLVHWNTELFKDVSEAISQDQGIAVLGVFLKAGKENPAVGNLTSLLKEISYKGNTFRMKKGYNPASLLPENTKDYWTYEGSLTTPPCFESVRFILFKEPLEVSSEQLNEFRALNEHCKSDIPCCKHNGKMVDNFRPCMPLNGRVVTASFAS